MNFHKVYQTGLKSGLVGILKLTASHYLGDSVSKEDKPIKVKVTVRMSKVFERIDDRLNQQINYISRVTGFNKTDPAYQALTAFIRMQSVCTDIVSDRYNEQQVYLIFEKDVSTSDSLELQITEKDGKTVISSCKVCNLNKRV